MYSKIYNDFAIGGSRDITDFRKEYPNGNVICVADWWEVKNDIDRNVVLIPILRGGYDEYSEQLDEWVDPRALKSACILVNYFVNSKEPLLVCCGEGQERAPLVAAWFFHEYRGHSLDDAYEYIRSKREHIYDRRCWLDRFGNI